MRRSTLALLAVAAVFAGAGNIASAADLGNRPVYKAPVAPVMAGYDWTGLYVGGHIGYGWATNDWRDTVGLFNVSTNPSGFLGGAQVGFNYQINQVVLGLETDATWSDLSKTSNTLASSFNARTDWFGTVTGRVGWAVDRWLVYGKGGFAWADDRYSTNFYAVPGTEVKINRTGYTLGAGVEYAFAPNWSAKLEYNYLDFGRSTVSFAPGFATDVNDRIHTVKLGLNYKFGPNPIVARY